MEKKANRDPSFYNNFYGRQPETSAQRNEEALLSTQRNKGAPQRSGAKEAASALILQCRRAYR